MINKKNIIEELISSISADDFQKSENRMRLAAKIIEAMKAKGWKKVDLMRALGKENASEITRWLSGTHNFTCDTLFDIGKVLEIELINLREENKKENVTEKYHFTPKQNKKYKYSIKVIMEEPLKITRSVDTPYLNTCINNVLYDGLMLPHNDAKIKIYN